MISKRKVFGVGINDANYQVDYTKWVDGKQTLLWRCPYYIKWKAMLRRCYSKDRYEECGVYLEWLKFTSFREWASSTGIEEEELCNYDLDKDIIGNGKFYSPISCMFIPHVVNCFVLDKAGCKSPCLRGVYNRKGKYIARCNNPLTKEREYLGSYSDEVLAHRVWCDRKMTLVEELTTAFNLPDKVRCKLIEKFNYDA
jgi:hypothetical protein